MMELWNHLAGALPFDWAQFGFMRNALLAVLLISPIFAMLGCMVVNNQMSFFSEAVGHATLTGLAIGLLVGLVEPFWAMLAFAIVLALAVTVLRRFSAASADTIIGLVMAFTVALGIVLLSRGGNFARYSRYLVGDVLTVSPVEIGRLALLGVLFLMVWVLFFNRIFTTSINRSLAQSRGVGVWSMEALFAVTVAVIVTASVSLAGLLVLNSLLILPAAASRNLARGLAGYVWMAVAVSLVSGVGGLIASYYWNTATGATIVLIAMGIFLVSLVLRRR